MPPRRPTGDETPDRVKPFAFHGADLSRSSSGSQHAGDCVFCGKEGKFFVSEETGLWDCKSCGAKGNPLTFLRQLWDASDKSTSDYSALASDRGLLYPDTAMRWGAARSVVDGAWLLPGYDAAGKLCTLYRYCPMGPRRRMTLLATPGFAHGLHLAHDADRSLPAVDVCEGPWDGMALDEVQRVSKAGGDGHLQLTGNVAASLAARSLVVAVPGCNVFPEAWLPLFAGKRVRLWYDSDHPKPHPKTGAEVGLQGWTAMRRVAEILSKAERPPESIEVLRWGEGGYDPGAKSGWDVRDQLLTASGVNERVVALGVMLGRVEPIPADWVKGRSKTSAKSGSVEVEPLPCKDWRTLVNAWRQAMAWIDGLDRAFANMLATVLSTDAAGDQLWFKVIGPPSCGKSTLCEAISAAKKWVVAKSTLTGFHSGYDDGSGENYSPLLKMNGKTLVTKDGDTLMKAGNLEVILSEARDIYDGSSRSAYRNRQGKDHEGLRITWILCGTKDIRDMDATSLGARFLDSVVMEEIDEDVEHDINVQVAARIVAVLQGGKQVAVGHDDADMLRAKRLTMGYVDFLRTHTDQLLGQVSVADRRMLQIVNLGKFVSFMRARPSVKHDETADREMSMRLVSQHTRLAMCLAAVLGKREVDGDVMARVRRVAMDTARGSSLRLCQTIHAKDVDTRLPGCETAALALWTDMRDADLRQMLRFLKRIKVVTSLEKDDLKRLGLPTSARRWLLTDKFRVLFDEVMTET